MFMNVGPAVWEKYSLNSFITKVLTKTT